MIHSMDWIIILVIISFGVLGYKRGFLEEFGRLLGLFVSAVSALSFHSKIAIGLYEHTPFELPVLIFTSFIFIFFISLFTIRILTKLIQVFMLSKGIGAANKSLGFLFGSIKGIIIIIIIFRVMDIYPKETMKRFKSSSILYGYLTYADNWAIKSFGLDDTMKHSKRWIDKKLGNNKELAK